MRMAAAAIVLVALPQPAVAQARATTDARAAQLVAAAARKPARGDLRRRVRRIPYPGATCPRRGVCTDVVIRAYRRSASICRSVHEDMTRAFEAYPQLWGMPGPTRNRSPPRSQPADVLPRAGAALSVARDPRAIAPAISSRGYCPATSRTSVSSPAARRRARRWSCTTSGAGRKKRTCSSRSRSPGTIGTASQ